MAMAAGPSVLLQLLLLRWDGQAGPAACQMGRLHKERSFMEACKILDQLITWKLALPVIPILGESDGKEKYPLRKGLGSGAGCGAGCPCQPPGQEGPALHGRQLMLRGRLLSPCSLLPVQQTWRAERSRREKAASCPGSS